MFPKRTGVMGLQEVGREILLGPSQDAAIQYGKNSCYVNRNDSATAHYRTSNETINEHAL